MRAGWNVSIPYGDNARYDFVIEKTGDFQRVQCKTGRLTKAGNLTFNICSIDVYGGQVRKSYEGQIEFFGVYDPHHNKCYLVPLKDIFTHTAMTLKITDTANGNDHGIPPASKYEI